MVPGENDSNNRGGNLISPKNHKFSSKMFSRTQIGYVSDNLLICTTISTHDLVLSCNFGGSNWPLTNQNRGDDSDVGDRSLI